MSLSWRTVQASLTSQIPVDSSPSCWSSGVPNLCNFRLATCAAIKKKIFGRDSRAHDVFLLLGVGHQDLGAWSHFLCLFKLFFCQGSPKEIYFFQNLFKSIFFFRLFQELLDSVFWNFLPKSGKKFLVKFFFRKLFRTT